VAGDILAGYGAQDTLTVTNLHSLASSQDYLTGWCSQTFTNTSNLFLDALTSGSFTTHASNRQAGFINVYLIAPVNDTPSWPASATGTVGTQGTLSFTDTEERDAACTLIASLPVDATASAVIPWPQEAIAALKRGVLPSHYCLYVSQNCSTTTTAGLAAAGTALYHKGVKGTYTG
jgi:hypothetical protein